MAGGTTISVEIMFGFIKNTAPLSECVIRQISRDPPYRQPRDAMCAIGITPLRCLLYIIFDAISAIPSEFLVFLEKFLPS